MTNTNDSRRRRKRLSVGLGIAAVIGLLVAAAVFIPRPATSIVTVDGASRWSNTLAPPSREVVWTPAERVSSQPFDQRGEVSHIRPQPAEHDTVLYFTVRTPEDQYDIHQVRRIDDGWSKAAPVAELNSAQNDIGPVLRADGKVLYIYSDRDGGLGGMDLYVSTRTERGWSRPQNLGPRVNSPAHEYDPAITPDGNQLFYASNRSAKIHQWMSDGSFDADQDQWTTTLRADLGLRKFDLYVANHKNSQWEGSQPLGDLNTRNYNEGAPHISPNGAFLYFVSDRPVRAGEEENFDVFRTHTRQPGRIVENLGPGVNTPANEIEPSLSSEGFRLFFSRDIDDPARDLAQYALFQSTAEEVETDVTWEAGNWHAFSGWLSAIARQLGNNWWQILLSLLLIALAAAAIRFVRRASLRHARLPGFLLVALALHLLLATGSFFTYFGQQIVDQIKQTFDDEVVATQVLTELNQSHEHGEQSYEKVADLTTPDTLQPTEVDRQVTTTPNVPVPIETAIPQIPSRVTRESPTDPVVATVLIETQPRSAPPPLDRRPAPVHEVHEQVATVVTKAVQSETPLPRKSTEVELDRAPVQQAEAPMPRASVDVSDPVMQVVADAIEAERPATSTPTSPQVELSVDRAPQSQVVQASYVATESIQARESQSMAATAEPVDVALDRARVAAPPTLATLPRAAVEQSRPLELAKASPGAKPIMTSSPSSSAPTPLERASSAPFAASPADAEVALAKPVAVENAPASQAKTTAQVAIALPRATTPAAVAGNVHLPAKGSAESELPRTARADLSRTPQSESDLPASSAAASLARTARAAAAQSTARQDTVATAEVSAVASETTAEHTTTPDADVKLARVEQAAIEIPVNSARAFGGPADPLNSRLVIGSLAKDEVNAPISTSPIASRLLRRPARAPRTSYADDSVNLRSLLNRRVVDAATKAKIVKQFGGSDETLETIRRGISWIEQHQHKDGHWGLHDFNHNCQGHKKCSGHGGSHSDTAGTGLALLPLLGDGNTHKVGPRRDAVARGITWLVSHQKETGDLFTGGERNAWMYSHGIATIALCECYGMSGDPALRGPAQRAIDFIVEAQHEGSGGWRYQPKQAGDTSVVGWQVMALKSGQMADLNVPQRTLEGAKKWLAFAGGKGGKQGQFFYQKGRFNPAMTAEGMLCLEYLGVERNSPRLRHGGDFLLRNLPKKGKESSYYWYYGTQAMFHLQGEHWEHWNEALHPMLKETQVQDGQTAGTWDPKDNWEGRGGRIYSTSLRLLMLEVYYRHLPLFQVLEEAP